ncbi:MULTISPECIES: hypothetical protein [Acidiphilium]|uniref:Uncharacterized protein n=1 Tax=Acidiphilium rubrum TaxID=526 RepID=A0A8G2FCN0_ACIRU|nr:MULTISPECIES: hypothetical protein [Acidiphilium]SIQ05671.1 hypothetical protein SAMN05421828_101105 [Acidiphilium rubrum]
MDFESGVVDHRVSSRDSTTFKARAVFPATLCGIDHITMTELD